MRLPILTELPSAKENIEEFRGYNHNIRIAPSEWYDMKNMTTDYYPVASTRDTREIGVLYEGYGTTFTYDGETYSVEDKLIGFASINTNIITLHRVKKGNNYVGIWFMKGAHLVGENHPEQIVEKMQYFQYTDGSKRNLVKMGSYICAFPDGVVYESANTTDEVPIFKVEQTITPSDFLQYVTLIKSYNSDNKYDVLAGGDYRYNDKSIEHYIEDDALWVKQPTFVIIYKTNTTGTFDNLKEGDVVEISFDGNIEGVTSYKDGIFNTDTNKANVKIVEMGTLSNGTNISQSITNDTDYIIVEGFIYTANGLGVTSYSMTTYESSTIKRKKPDFSKLVCESQNRLWTCDKKGHEIYASALGNPYNFYDYSGLATDSYAVNVGTEYEWTGCFNYRGNPIFFKENAAHIISGSYPTNLGQLDGGSYAVTTLTDFRGVEANSENSLVVIDNILYYKGQNGIVAFDGTNTTIVSEALGDTYYSDAISGSTKSKYYVSMKDLNNQYHLFVYDTKKGMWSKEDNLKAEFVWKYNDYFGFISYIDYPQVPNDVPMVYGISYPKYPDGDSSHTESIFFGGVDWMCETGTIGYSYPNNKYLSRFQVRMQISEGARASIYIQYDSDGVWHKKGDMEGKGTRSFLLPIVPQRCDHMKIKFEGKGDVKIISLAKILEEGGDV